MTHTRIYAPGPYQPDQRLELPETARDHLRARRLRPGAELTLFDGHGTHASAVMEELHRRGASATIQNVEQGSPESPVAVTLIQGIGKSDAMDLVIQKATELGVARILPVYTDNSVVRLKGDRAARKRGHWQRVVVSACEQCGRNIVPEVDAPQSLSQAMNGLSDCYGIVVSAEADQGLSAMATTHTRLALAVGPEGGFSDAEHRRFSEASWQAVRMGPRVLRTETAALTGLAAIGLRFGDMG